MNNSKCCVPCVCTSSGCKQSCERHDIYIMYSGNRIKLGYSFINSLLALTLKLVFQCPFHISTVTLRTAKVLPGMSI